MVTDADVLRYLSALDFPADKEAILREAEREGAPGEVLRALRAMPPVDYADTSEVARSAATEVAPELDAADLAAQAREPHHRVARRLRRI